MRPSRHVLFIGGFDPKSPAHYHRLYRAAARQRPAGSPGAGVDVGRQRTQDGHWHHWEVDWHTDDGAVVRTRYGVWAWDDIVRSHWPRNLWRALRDYRAVYASAHSAETLWQVRKVNPAAFWLAVFPLLIALGCLAGAGAAGAWLGGVAGLSGTASFLWSLLPGIALWRLAEQALDAEWLLRLFAFTQAQATDQVPELDRRIDDMARQLVEAARQAPESEWLVVGHSTGAIVAASVMARALQLAPSLAREVRHLSLLTLAHCTPILAFQRPARRFQQELQRLADEPGLTWVEYTAANDWAAFSRIPPWLRTPVKGLKLQRSPRFHRCLSAPHYQALLKDRHQLHMQYLKAPDLPGGYDPVTLTAGPQTLAQQHPVASP